MRRLISFLLLAAAAAAPLAAQDRDPQDARAQRGERGDRGDRVDAGDRGGRGERRPDYSRGNRPDAVQAAPAPQAAVAAQAIPQPVPQATQPAPGRFGQGNGAVARRNGGNDPRGDDRNGGRFDPRRGQNDARDPDFARRAGGTTSVGGGLAEQRGPGNGYGNRPDERNRPGNGYAGRPGDWRDDRGRPGNGNYTSGGYGNDGYRNGGINGGGLGWSGQWRNDRRYDWQGYRSANRNLFRAPRYYGPRGYDYSRWSRGYRVEPFFYGRNYWIADPWRYRLPPADGYYRWVRYYDDVALVDIRTGLIEDIIYSFFWR